MKPLNITKEHQAVLDGQKLLKFQKLKVMKNQWMKHLHKKNKKNLKNNEMLLNNIEKNKKI